ncbi:hypothetical protein EAG_02098 [Camponotus floridanus]|uniref:Uncharacterized protein n=1 Tax=Camponotus floridanus TaxID=104421 RepID=E2B1N0_CAMFO|nr:hypothetical protein EAG_02098 [Camponotus floridanus]
MVVESQEERVEIIATRGPTVKNVGFLTRVKGTAEESRSYRVRSLLAPLSSVSKEKRTTRRGRPVTRQNGTRRKSRNVRAKHVGGRVKWKYLLSPGKYIATFCLSEAGLEVTSFPKLILPLNRQERARADDQTTPRYVSLFLSEREANANLGTIVRDYVVLLENSTCPIFLLTPSSNNLLLAAPVCATKERSLSILPIVIQCHVCGNVFVRKTCHLVVLLFYVLPPSDEGGMFMTKVARCCGVKCAVITGDRGKAGKKVVNMTPIFLVVLLAIDPIIAQNTAGVTASTRTCVERAVDLSVTRKGPLPRVFELPRNYDELEKEKRSRR